MKKWRILCRCRPYSVLRLKNAALPTPRGRDPQVGQEPEHVGLAVLQAFQQEPAGLLPCLRAGDPANLLQAGEDAERDRPGSAAGCSSETAAIPRAGLVRGVDEGAERVRGLAGPDGVRVGLGGVLQIAQQVSPRSAGV